MPEWWDRLSSGTPVVHVSQGAPRRGGLGLHRFPVGLTLEGLADEDVLVVVSTGNAPLDGLPPLSANAARGRVPPYDWPFLRPSVFVEQRRVRRAALPRWRPGI